MNAKLVPTVLLTAGRMAAQGLHQPALVLLDALPAGEAEVAVCLLRAKILAQQGRYAEALRQWQRVLERDPANAEARRGRELALEVRSGTSASDVPRRVFARALLLVGECLGGLRPSFWPFARQAERKA